MVELKLQTTDTTPDLTERLIAQWLNGNVEVAHSLECAGSRLIAQWLNGNRGRANGRPGYVERLIAQWLNGNQIYD